jgi:hypothetical protein
VSKLSAVAVPANAVHALVAVTILDALIATPVAAGTVADAVNDRVPVTAAHAIPACMIINTPAIINPIVFFMVSYSFMFL